eukprot:1354785-Rhodomonas_salina.1
MICKAVSRDSAGELERRSLGDCCVDSSAFRMTSGDSTGAVLCSRLASSGSCSVFSLSWASSRSELPSSSRSTAARSEFDPLRPSIGETKCESRMLGGNTLLIGTGENCQVPST